MQNGVPMPLFLATDIPPLKVKAVSLTKNINFECMAIKILVGTDPACWMLDSECVTCYAVSSL